MAAPEKRDPLLFPSDPSTSAPSPSTLPSPKKGNQSQPKRAVASPGAKKSDARAQHGNQKAYGATSPPHPAASPKHPPQPAHGDARHHPSPKNRGKKTGASQHAQHQSKKTSQPPRSPQAPPQPSSSQGSQPSSSVSSSRASGPKYPAWKPPHTTKSQNAREADRATAALPIHNIRNGFEDNLISSRVIVVTADTGSGKTTQLPQYAAEVLAARNIRGLVVCTQPRSIAAVSIASRIAHEFDGRPTGGNVGHSPGSKQFAQGNQIVLATDSALVRWNQDSPDLDEISVLIIDEAHERSLYTDLVLGIAKELLLRRPNFYVVIASATIDHREFINFFQVPNLIAPIHLHCQGRPFEVKMNVYALPEDVDWLRDLADITFEAIHDYPDGNVLVFVPGSGEADRACSDFARSASQHYLDGVTLVPMVLYGALPAEEQQKAVSFDDKGGSQRMILFCTNIAETSLTMPNIRLVIDTGLAKEARFDTTRRIQVLELVEVSKSSCTQRRGRAGRTAPGVYMPLFDPDMLARENVAPEITRSSLDLVALDLCILGKNPEVFDWITPPKLIDIQTALQTLEYLQCIAQVYPEGSSPFVRHFRPMPLGKAFTRLPFDPRISFFIHHASRFNLVVLATEIASIIASEGDIHFVGGKTPQERQDFLQQRRDEVKHHDSDLFYLHSKFKTWQRAGWVPSSDKKCLRCARPVNPAANGCRPCRVQFAKNHSLNNKTLEIISNMTKNTLYEFANCSELSDGAAVPSWDKYSGDLLNHFGIPVSPLPSLDFTRAGLTKTPYRTLSETHAISISLAFSFREQICQLIEPSLPSAGVFIMDRGLRASIGKATAWGEKIAVAPDLFPVALALRINSIHGAVFCDMTHPVSLDWLGEEERARLTNARITLKHFLDRPNLNAHFYKSLQQELTVLARNGNVAAQWLFLTYTGGNISGYTPDRHVAIMDPEGNPIVAAQLDDLELKLTNQLEDAVSRRRNAKLEVIAEGDSNMTSFASGLKILSLGPALPLQALRIDVTTLFGDNKVLHTNLEKTFTEWVAKRCKIPASKIQRCTVDLTRYHRVGTAYVSEPIADMIVKSKGVPLVRLPTHGRTVKFTYFPHDAGLELDDLLEDLGDRASVIVRKEHLPQFIIQGILPDHVTRDSLLAFLNASEGDKAICRIGIHSVTTWNSKKGKRNATIILRAEDDFLPVSAILGRYHRLPLQHKNYFVLLTFMDTNDVSLLPQRGVHDLEYQNSIPVPHFEVFKDYLNSFSRDLRSQGSPVVASIQYPKDGAKTYFKTLHQLRLGCSTLQTLKQVTDQCERALKPLEIPLHTPQMELMAKELIATPPKEMAEALKMVRLEIAHRRTLAIYGTRVNIAAFMALYSIYDSPTRVPDLPPSVASLPRFPPRFSTLGLTGAQFELIKLGGTLHKTWTECMKKLPSVNLVLNDRLMVIQMVVSIENADNTRPILTRANQAISDMLTSISAQPAVEDKCVYCCNKGRQTFNICGHHYCQPCLLESIQRLSRPPAVPVAAVPAATAPLLCCPRCNEVVDLKDFSALFTSDPEGLRRVVQTQLLRDAAILQEFDLVGCGINGCLGLKHSDVYSSCPLCKVSSCPSCKATNSPTHSGRTCQEAEQASIIALANLQRAAINWEDLITQAKYFIATNWSRSLGLYHISPNYNLLQNCGSALLFEAAYKAVVEQSGGVPKFIFAWHGTRSDAGILSICRNGFDTSRRNGQVHGPGEYFGVSSEISHEYCFGNPRMLLCALISSPVVTRSADFCYVVNNPLGEGVGHHCVPLAVITFGPDCHTLPDLDLGERPRAPEPVQPPPRRMPVVMPIAQPSAPQRPLANPPSVSAPKSAAPAPKSGGCVIS